MRQFDHDDKLRILLHYPSKFPCNNDICKYCNKAHFILLKISNNEKDWNENIARMLVVYSIN